MSERKREGRADALTLLGGSSKRRPRKRSARRKDAAVANAVPTEAEQAEFNRAFGKACRLSIVETELQSDLPPARRRAREREARALHNFFTQAMRRKALTWQRPLWQAARKALANNHRLPLSRLLDDPLVKKAYLGISRKRAHEFLASMGFGLKKPGRPKKYP